MIKFNENDIIEFDINDKDAIIVQRQILGKTKRDQEIENLSLEGNSFGVKIAIKSLRFYQNNISEKLGNRCVFDPSCSHYSELAYRKSGIIQGTLLTIKRLKKCRPENGGIDEI